MNIIFNIKEIFIFIFFVGVVKLKFDPNSTKKVARLDLTFGDLLSGFTFNIGDSPTNNAYGKKFFLLKNLKFLPKNK